MTENAEDGAPQASPGAEGTLGRLEQAFGDARCFGSIPGPDGAFVSYAVREADGRSVVTLGGGSAETPVAVYVEDLLHALGQPYLIPAPEAGWRKAGEFGTEEKAKLRPVAETLAMLDGNAFFGMDGPGGVDIWESYLPEAAALYASNGGDEGWAGRASFGPGARS